MTDDDLDVDPALAAAVLEIETHIAEAGWDQPARLYALVETARLVEREPALAAAMGLDSLGRAGVADPGRAGPAAPGPAARAGPRVDRLARRAWPAAPRSSSGWCCRRTPTTQIPEDPAEAEEFAREHPDRQEVRIVAGATRAGSTYCALRLRAHDDDQSVVAGTDLVPALLQLLAATLEDDE